MFLEVDEADTRRDSFTVTFRGAHLPLRDFIPNLLRLAGSLALPRARCWPCWCPTSRAASTAWRPARRTDMSSSLFTMTDLHRYATRRRRWMTPAALAAMLGADGLRRARAADRSHPAQIQTDAGLLRTDPVGPQERDHALPAPSARMDQVAALPAPRFDDKTQLPAPAAYRADEMPAYNAAELPAQADPMTLDQVYMMALQNDPQLRGAYQELQAVGYGVMAARAGLLPSVTGEANRSRVKQRSTARTPSTRPARPTGTRTAGR